jgi:predicted signal transduction protein with EAL and GGDEF domain
MLPDIDDVHIVDAVASKLQTALQAPMFVDPYDIRMTASAGRVAYPHDGESRENLMSMADEALYRAKAARNLVSIHNSSGRLATNGQQ